MSAADAGCVPRATAGNEPDGRAGPAVASVSGRDGRGAMGRAVTVASMAACLAVLGLVLGAPLGILAGVIYTRLAGTSTSDGNSAMLILFTFGPLGALLGGAALSASYLVRLLRRSWTNRPVVGGRLHPGTWAPR